MDVNNYQILNEQRENLQIKINNLNNQLTKLETIPFKERIRYCLSLALTPYLITLHLSKVLLNLESISPAIINYLTVGLSLTIGLVSETFLLSELKFPSLWQNFLHYKTIEKKKLKYKIEIEKLENQIKILEKIETKIFFQDDTTFSQLPSQVLTNNKIKELKSILKEKMKYLNVLSTKKILKERFYQERQSTKLTLCQRIFQSLAYSFFAAIIFNLPSFYIQETLNCFSSTTIIPPLLISYLTTYSYQTIKFRENLKLFKEFNSELKINCLPEKENYQYEKNIERELEESINNIIKINSQINREKIKLLIPIYLINQQYNSSIKQVPDYQISSFEQSQITNLKLTKIREKVSNNYPY